MLNNPNETLIPSSPEMDIFNKENTMPYLSPSEKLNNENVIPNSSIIDNYKNETILYSTDDKGIKNKERPTRHKVKYSIDNDYPSIKNVKKNPYIAKIIQENYSSLVSEFSAVSQYSYDHIVAESQNEKVADAFIDVAIVEMHHLEILGELIVALGAIPYYKGDWKNKFWQGNFVRYNTNLRTMLLCAISDEKKAIKQYEKSIELIDDPEIVSLIERIILDEELHIEVFKELLKELD